MNTGGRRCIVFRRGWLRQGRSQLREWHIYGLMPVAKLLKWETRCMQNFRRQKRQGVLAIDRRKIYFLSINIMWLRCRDLSLKRCIRRWKIWKKSLQM